MLDRQEREIFNKIFQEEYKDLISRMSVNAPLSLVRESFDPQFIDLKELEDFLEGKELPYIANTRKKTVRDNSPNEGQLRMIVGILPKGAKDKKGAITLVYNLGYNENSEEVSVSMETSDNEVREGDFMGKFQMNPKSQYKSIYDIINLCDYDRFYVTYKNQALDLVGKRFDKVRQVFKLIQSERDGNPKTTLWVGYDKIMRNYVMGYNPSFILMTVLEEWSVKRGKYRSLVDCYCYILGFLIAHEMSHLIRHNSDSESGRVDTNSVNHLIDNVIQDSYINTNLADIFSGLVGSYDDSISLDGGIGKDFGFRSSASEGGLKKFKTLNDLSKALVNAYASVLNAKKVSISDGDVRNVVGLDLNKELYKLENSQLYLKFICQDGWGAYKSTSINFTTTINTLIKSIVDGRMYRAETGLTKGEAKDLGIVNTADGALVGQRVRDIKSGKIGVVISDVGGELKIHFTEDLIEIERIVTALKAAGLVRGL